MKKWATAYTNEGLNYVILHELIGKRLAGIIYLDSIVFTPAAGDKRYNFDINTGKITFPFMLVNNQRVRVPYYEEFTEATVGSFD